MRGYEEHSPPKTFQNNEGSNGKCHLGTVSTHSWPESPYVHAALGTEAGGDQEHFQAAGCPTAPSQEPPSPECHFLPFVWAFFFLNPISLLHWVISFLYGECFWEHGAISSQHPAHPHHVYPAGSQGKPWGSSGFP